MMARKTEPDPPRKHRVVPKAAKGQAEEKPEEEAAETKKEMHDASRLLMRMSVAVELMAESVKVLNSWLDWSVLSEADRADVREAFAAASKAMDGLSELAVRWHTR
jgi:hypothetical protein